MSGIIEYTADRYWKWPVVFLLFISLPSCVTTPTPKKQINYGGYHDTRSCSNLAEQTIRYRLKDPDSAQFRHGTCGKGSAGGFLSAKEYGYLQTGQVNAKNSCGAFTGFVPYRALIRNSRVLYYCIADNKYGLCTMAKPSPSLTLKPRILADFRL